MKKKMLSLVLVAAMAMSVLVGCGGGTKETTADTKAETTVETTAETTAEAEVLPGGGSNIIYII